ncbi:MAG: 30S ribosomal protein S12 methylthiotransferase RimO [Candidatus Margulisiibacteriota bacterium]
MKSNFSLISLGCARTLVDSEEMVQSMQTVGFKMVPEGTKEEVMVLNTCSFIQAAIDETEANIEQLLERKKRHEIKYVCVVGCYPSRFKASELAAKYPDVDLWCSTKDEKNLHKQMAELVFKTKFIPETKKTYTKISPSHYAYLKISEGCDNWCTFCTIPKIRGTHTSKTINEIRHEAKIQMAMGAKELIIIAEDTTAWGEDLYGEPCLERLIEGLADLDVWIRLMYIFPSRVTDKLIKTIANTKNVIPYIDMPIQHVNSDLLAAMNRRHDKSFLIDVINKMRSAIPNLAIRTSFICGFPGETEAHVTELCDFLAEHHIDHIGCFTYSKERETRSARFAQQVTPEIAKERVDTIMSHHINLRGNRQLTRMGEVINVLYEGNRTCRSVFEAPEVDNLIILDQDPGVPAGSLFKVKLNGVSGIDFLAKKIK